MEKFNIYSLFQLMSGAEDAQYKTFDDWFTEFFKSNLDNLTESELAYIYYSMNDWDPYLLSDGDEDKGKEHIEKTISLVSENAKKRNLVLGSYIDEDDLLKTMSYCEEISADRQKEDEFWSAEVAEMERKEVKSGTLNFLYVVVPIIIIILIIVIATPDKECEEVIWYEYGEKKTGIICDEARDQMNAVRDEMGIYKKDE